MNATTPRPFRAPITLYAPPTCDAIDVLVSLEDETIFLNLAWAHWDREPEEWSGAVYGRVESKA